VANFTSGQDLLAAALRFAGELPNSNSSYYTTALEEMNMLYMDILSGGSLFLETFGEPFPWAKKQTQGVLILEVPYETGTLALTQGSTSVTFSGAPAASQAGKLLKVSGQNEYAFISAHTAGQAGATLDGTWTGETDATAEYSLHKIDYTLSSHMRLLEPLRVGRSRINLVDPAVLGQQYPLEDLQSGVPLAAALIRESDGTVTLRFSHSADEPLRVEYEQVQLPTMLTDSSGSIPVIPREHRAVLAFATAYLILVQKNSTKQQFYLNLTVAKLRGLQGDARKELSDGDPNFGRLLPRQEEVARNPLQTESGIEID
jgi:hypothetical protein